MSEFPPGEPGDPQDERGGEAEVPDQPLGTPADMDEEEAPLPGIPEAEPPTAG